MNEEIKNIENAIGDQGFPLEIPDCRNVDFYFNKHSLVNADFPNWVVRTKGATYYVSDVITELGFSTRNRPDGNTRGWLRFGRCSLSIDSDGVARIH